ncbi:hypothetical protein HBI56_173450 [Parastagonospora nodorum]|nr:hypothetical protein HBI10_177410 [Parastagonospora nodorum]KAH4017649.1 hypothetical protein HBI13_142950 [Parastagonospora nodorum]KAH4104799.1 hypothetical protein HBH46_092220 [Parastagonospora nodorum]KAH4185074.1 hypothetical protein HBH42_183850 [Parastagonospora nodorum]KAH4216305.1 hypothetical protein HBI06_233560 [Parastagonospora nodorum]
MDDNSIAIEHEFRKVEIDLGLHISDRAGRIRSVRDLIVGVFWIVQMQEEAEYGDERIRSGFTTDENLLMFSFGKYSEFKVQGYNIVARSFPKDYDVLNNNEPGESLSQTYGYWYENGSRNDDDIVIGASGHFLHYLSVLPDRFFQPLKPFEGLQALQGPKGLDIKRYRTVFQEIREGVKVQTSNFWIVGTKKGDASMFSWDISTSLAHVIALKKRDADDQLILSYDLSREDWRIACFRTFYVVGERMLGPFSCNPANMLGSTSRLAKTFWKEAWDMAKKGKRVDDGPAIVPLEVDCAQDMEKIYDPEAENRGTDELLVEVCRLFWRAADVSMRFDQSNEDPGLATD